MLSSPALALSFGKLLELKFYAGSYIPRSTGAAIGDQGPVSSCVHSLHHSHVQFFGYQNYQAEFEYVCTLHTHTYVCVFLVGYASLTYVGQTAMLSPLNFTDF